MDHENIYFKKAFENQNGREFSATIKPGDPGSHAIVISFDDGSKVTRIATKNLSYSGCYATSAPKIVKHTSDCETMTLIVEPATFTCQGATFTSVRFTNPDGETFGAQKYEQLEGRELTISKTYFKRGKEAVEVKVRTGLKVAVPGGREISIYSEFSEPVFGTYDSKGLYPPKTAGHGLNGETFSMQVKNHPVGTDFVVSLHNGEKIVPLKEGLAVFEIDPDKDEEFKCYFTDGCNESAHFQIVAAAYRALDVAIRPEVLSGEAGVCRIRPLIGRALAGNVRFMVLRTGEGLHRLAKDGTFHLVPKSNAVYHIVVYTKRGGFVSSQPFNLENIDCGSD